MEGYSLQYLVGPGDMDTNYRLTHVSALGFMQDCFARYTSEYHLAAFDIWQQHKLWIIAEIQVEFIPDEMPYWTDIVNCNLWISEVSGARLYTDFTLTNEHNKLFAKGYCCWSMIDADERRVIRVDEPTSAMPVLHEFIIGPHHRYNMEETGIPLLNADHRVSVTEIDFNHHMNNRAFLQLALAVMSTPEFTASHAIHNLSVKFIHEAFLGENLKIDVICNPSDTNTLRSIIRNEKGTACCYVSTNWVEYQQPPIFEYYDKKRRNMKR